MLSYNLLVVECCINKVEFTNNDFLYGKEESKRKRWITEVVYVL